VSPYVLFIVAILLPTAVGYAAIFGIRGLRWAGERRPRRAPAPEPIERLARTLRRLRAELETMETRTGVPNKSVRVNQAEIYRVEAGLRQRGLDVREPAAH
jgi:hypothetical protein